MLALQGTGKKKRKKKKQHVITASYCVSIWCKTPIITVISKGQA